MAPELGLDDREVEMLAFERQWWQRAGSKEQTIRDLFDLTPTEYYRRLSRLIDRVEALEAEPMIVNRLRDLRHRRARLRSLRRTA